MAALLLATLTNGPVGALLGLRLRLLLGLALVALITLALAGGLLLAIPIRLRLRLLLALALLALLTLALTSGLLPAIPIRLWLRLLLRLALVALTLLTLALFALTLASGLLLGAIGFRLRLLALASGLGLAAFTLAALALCAWRLTLRHPLPLLAFAATLCAAWRTLTLGRTFLLAASARHFLRGRKHEAAQKCRRGGTNE